MTDQPSDPNHEETEETTPDVDVNVEGDAEVTVKNGDENVARNDGPSYDPTTHDGPQDPHAPAPSDPARPGEDDEE